MSATDINRSGARTLLSRVPEVTLLFWVIKVMCTVVGETAADALTSKLNLGLTNTTIITSVILATVLFVQFRARRYVPVVFWLALATVSIVGTLITDNLVEDAGWSLAWCAIAMALALVAIFCAWQASEHTVSIHSIRTTRREAFYWLAILCSFALGTALEDLVSEKWAVGYGTQLLVFAVLITMFYAGSVRLGVKSELSFWSAFVLTNVFGASNGDLLSNSKGDGGLGWGNTATSLIFLIAVATVIGYMTVRQSRRRVFSASSDDGYR